MRNTYKEPIHINGRPMTREEKAGNGLMAILLAKRGVIINAAPNYSNTGFLMAIAKMFKMSSPK